MLGMTWRPQGGATRLMVGLLWLFFIIVSAIYTGNLVAFLAVPRIPAPLDTVSQLADQNEYKVGLVKGQALYQVLSVSAKKTRHTRGLTVLCFIYHSNPFTDDTIYSSCRFEHVTDVT